MKKFFIIILFAVLPALLFAGSQRKTKLANRETVAWRYELQHEAEGAQNTVLVKVWSYSKDVNVARKQALKNAIHGLVFKGAAGNNDVSKRVDAIAPLVKDASAEDLYADFFNAFFADGGDYAKYVTVTNTASAGSVVKMGKEYKVAVVVSVQHNELRRLLESKGIIRGLSSGF